MKHNWLKRVILLLAVSLHGVVLAQEPFLIDPRCGTVPNAPSEYCGIIEAYPLAPGGDFVVLVKPYSPGVRNCHDSTSNLPPLVTSTREGIDVTAFFQGGDAADALCGPGRLFRIAGPQDAGTYRIRLFFKHVNFSLQLLAAEQVVEVSVPEPIPALNAVGQWLIALGVLAIGLAFSRRSR